MRRWTSECRKLHRPFRLLWMFHCCASNCPHLLTSRYSQSLAYAQKQVLSVACICSQAGTLSRSHAHFCDSVYCPVSCSMGQLLRLKADRAMDWVMKTCRGEGRGQLQAIASNCGQLLESTCDQLLEITQGNSRAQWLRIHKKNLFFDILFFWRQGKPTAMTHANPEDRKSVV